ncbi:hypothetical protein ACTXT7_009970 [Hymenolepis weldensis]
MVKKEISPCVIWSQYMRMSHTKPGQPQLVFIKYNSPTNRTLVPLFDSSVENFRSCRNPGGKMAKPWCYVQIKETASGEFYVPHFYHSEYQKMSCKLDKCEQPYLDN